MKQRIRMISLLVCTVFLLASCIMPLEPTETLPTTDPTTTPFPTTGGVTPPATPYDPNWFLVQAEIEANQVLKRPTGGVVDVSKANYTYSDMAEDLRILATIYPSMFSYRVIGQSVAGRDLYVGILGNPNAPRQIIVTAAIHAREHMTSMLVMKQIEFYLSHMRVGGYNNSSYAELFNQFCFYIVPMVNPDGVMLSQEGLASLPTEEMKQTIRDIYRTEKHSYTDFDLYLSHWKANANGVDLNRNYDAKWEEYDKASAPQSYQYKGPAPESEPETRAIVALINSLSNPVCSLCIHSQGEVIYWNCGQTGDAKVESAHLANLISNSNGYRVINEQNNDASLSDWCELEKGIPAITVETGNRQCPLPIEQFADIWMDNYDLWALVAEDYWRMFGGTH